jgi:hypothetical protein
MSYPTRRVSLFDGSSGQSSTYTSDWHLVADYETLAVSWHTDGTDASLLTLTASLDDGFGSTIANTSTVTTITVAGVYAIDAGLRWLRAERGSEESLGITNLQLGM